MNLKDNPSSKDLVGTAKTTADEEDTPLLMKAAEHMAIRFALERYQKGEVKVNAVHQMMEHMSRQMDSLRQILKLQEEKMSKAGILVESHADILDRMFWAEVPESGKKSVLLSHEAPCVPPRHSRAGGRGEPRAARVRGPRRRAAGRAGARSPARRRGPAMER